MKHRKLIILIPILIILVLVPSCRGKRATSFAIGYFSFAPVPGLVTDLTKAALAEFGYIEGENATYLIRDAGGNLDTLPTVAQGLVDAHPDVIIVVGVTLAESIVAISEDIPLVVVSSFLLNQGFVDGYKNHGRNVTGISSEHPTERQLDYLLKIEPDIEQLLVPHSPKIGSAEDLALDRISKAAAERGIDIVIGEADSDDEVADMLANLPDGTDAIFVPLDRITHFPGDDANFIPFAIERKLPLVVSSNTSVANGALLSYAYDLVALTAQANRLTARILAGTPAGSLPIERPELFLTVNMATAEAIGVEIPDDVLEDADRIIR
jgi:putative tryptophan/tyrosine transport system substrate-binding protein